MCGKVQSGRGGVCAAELEKYQAVPDKLKMIQLKKNNKISDQHWSYVAILTCLAEQGSL